MEGTAGSDDHGIAGGLTMTSAVMNRPDDIELAEKAAMAVFRFNDQ